MITKFDLLVPQRDRGPRRATTILLGFALGLVACLDQPLPDPGADFPEAAIEPAIYKQMRGPHKMMIGLANDEIGYIIPKRQWDEKPPFCYGRKTSQYGERNSLGPDTAPIVCEAFRKVVKGKD